MDFPLIPARCHLWNLFLGHVHSTFAWIESFTQGPQAITVFLSEASVTGELVACRAQSTWIYLLLMNRILARLFGCWFVVHTRYFWSLCFWFGFSSYKENPWKRCNQRIFLKPRNHPVVMVVTHRSTISVRVNLAWAKIFWTTPESIQVYEFPSKRFNTRQGIKKETSCKVGTPSSDLLCRCTSLPRLLPSVLCVSLCPSVSLSGDIAMALVHRDLN